MTHLGKMILGKGSSECFIIDVSIPFHKEKK